MSKIYKIGGSQAGFQWGRLIFTSSKAACHRSTLLKSRGIYEGSIQEQYKVIGELNEERYLVEVAEKDGRPFSREMALRSSVNSFDSVTLSGRADFVYHDPSMVEVIELKAISSYAKQRDVMDGGHYKPENLAQLIAYMVVLNSTKGRLKYTRWKNKKLSKSAKDILKSADKNDYEAISDRTFQVEVDDFGRIIVDGTPSKFTVNDYLAHLHTAATVVTEGLIYDRPFNWDAKFGSPCEWCPFNKACDEYDQGNIEDVEVFVSIAKQCLESNTLGDE